MITLIYVTVTIILAILILVIAFYIRHRKLKSEKKENFCEKVTDIELNDLKQIASGQQSKRSNREKTKSQQQSGDDNGSSIAINNIISRGVNTEQQQDNNKKTIYVRMRPVPEQTVEPDATVDGNNVDDSDISTEDDADSNYIDLDDEEIVSGSTSSWGPVPFEDHREDRHISDLTDTEFNADGGDEDLTFTAAV